MTFEEINNLPLNLNAINVILEFLKNCDKKYHYSLNVLLLEIFYKYDDERFLKYYYLLDEAIPTNQDSYQKFLNIKCQYLLKNEKYDDCFQATKDLINKHNILALIYFNLNRFLDAKREYLLSNSYDINLAYIYLYENNYNDALNIASKLNDNNTYEYIYALNEFSKRGRLDFSKVVNPNDELRLRINISRIKASNNKNGYEIGKKYLEKLDQYYIGLRYQFYEAIYNIIPLRKEQEKVHFEMEKINNILSKPLIYKGEDKPTIVRLEELYKAFNDCEMIFSNLGKIDFKLPFREIYRLSMIELNKIIKFKEAIILFDHKDYVSIIDYKKNLAYDKDKQIELVINTPFEELLNDPREILIEDPIKLKKYKDIATGFRLLDNNINSILAFPIYEEDKCVGGLVFYSENINFFKNYNYEMIRVFTKYFLEKIQMKNALIKDIKHINAFKELYDNLDMVIKFIYEDEVFFNTYGEKFKDEVGLLDFYKTSLYYQESVSQVKNNIIPSFSFDFSIKDRIYNEVLKKINVEGDILLVSTIKDITDERKTLNYQTALAENSYLVNLPNRRMLEKNLIDYINDKFSLITLNINRFKMFNDVYGYEAGDIALKQIAKILPTINSNFSCFHLEADKFIILYPFINDSRTIKKTCNDIMRILNEKMLESNYRFNFTFTTSSLRYPVHTNDKRPFKLIKLAINGLYNAKDNKGIKSIYRDYDKEDYKNDIFEQILMTHVSEAIDSRNLLIKYQQVIDLSTSRVFQYEATPNISSFNVDPKYVLDIAKKRFLINDIDYYVIRHTLNDLKQIIEGTRKIIRVCIPIDISTLMKEDFENFIKNEIITSGVKAELISLEIKGSLEDYELINFKIQRLRNFGLKIQINEISDMIKISCDYIKLHSSSKFISNEKSLLTLKSIENMCDINGMHIIMADIDTIDEAQLLKGLGIKYVIGKCYANRISRDEFIKKIGEKNARISSTD